MVAKSEIKRGAYIFVDVGSKTFLDTGYVTDVEEFGTLVGYESTRTGKLTFTDASFVTAVLESLPKVSD